MENKISSIAGILQILSGILIIIAVYYAAPVCDKMLKLESGKEVAMKCAHSAKVFVILAIIIAVIGLLTLVLKQTNITGLQIIALLVAVFLFANTINFALGIGICMNAEMPCNQTALWVKIAAVISGLSALSALVFGNKTSQVK